MSRAFWASLALALMPLEATCQELVPPGFVVQMLEPTGGKLVRPETWHYRERHGSSQYGWIASREDPDDGPYLVGVRVQVLAFVEENTGKSGPEFVESFLSGKRRSAIVVSECPERSAGFFMRKCIETIEPPSFPSFVPFRVMHSLFYKPGLDMVAVSVAGSPIYEWQLHTDIFDAMSHIEIIDMSRFQ